MIDKIQVRLNNPAQYLACCGLLELAGLYDPNSTGYFTRDEFVLDSSVGLQTILNGLFCATITHSVTAVEELVEDVPISFNMNGYKILLDWWNYNQSLKCWSRGNTKGSISQLKGSDYNTISGNSSYFLFANTSDVPGLLVASQRLLRCGYNPADIFDLRITSKRLDIDPRTSWKVTDIGYSPNAASDRVGVETYAITELLAGIGLQRMQLRFTSEGELGYFEYYAWMIPLCVQTIIAANYCNCTCRKFRFYRESRSRNNSRFNFAEEQFAC